MCALALVLVGIVVAVGVRTHKSSLDGSCGERGIKCGSESEFAGLIGEPDFVLERTVYVEGHGTGENPLGSHVRKCVVVVAGSVDGVCASGAYYERLRGPSQWRSFGRQSIVSEHGTGLGDCGWQMTGVMNLDLRGQPLASFYPNAANFSYVQEGSLRNAQSMSSGIRAVLGGVGGLTRFSQSINGYPSLFIGAFPRVVDLGLGRSSGAAIGEIGTNGASRSYSGEYQSPDLQAVRETRLRALFGVPLLLIGIWLVYYCDRTFNRDFGWRGWLLWLSACACIICSFILLLYRGSLSSLKDLL